MGIKKLYSFLLSKNVVKIYPNLNNYINNYRRINKFKPTNMIITVDFWLYAYKYKYSYDHMIIGFWNQILKYLSHKIIPYYIIDSGYPEEKEDTIQDRKNKKILLEQKLEQLIQNNGDPNEIKRIKKSIIYISSTDINQIVKLFDIMNIPYKYAKLEGDALCASLVVNNIAWCCLSEDTDMLVFNCPRTIKINNNMIEEFDMEYIYNKLGLTPKQFVDMCIMFGCDYLKIYSKTEPDEIYNLIVKYKSIENILELSNHSIFNNKNKKIQHFIDNYNKIRMLYHTMITDDDIDKDKQIRITNQLDIDDILTYISSIVDIPYSSKNKIISSIGYVNNYIKNNCF